jgi:hypothetical protein
VSVQPAGEFEMAFEQGFAGAEFVEDFFVCHTRLAQSGLRRIAQARSVYADFSRLPA